MSSNPSPVADWRANLKEMDIPIAILGDELLTDVLRRLISGNRITKEIGVELYKNSSLPGLSSLANMIKQARFGDSVFFNDNLHVNTTNICVLACRFCAFRKGPRHKDAYSLSAEDFVARIEPYKEAIDEVHAVGGLHPEWTIENYCDIYRLSKKKFPDILTLIHI